MKYADRVTAVVEVKIVGILAEKLTIVLTAGLVQIQTTW